MTIIHGGFGALGPVGRRVAWRSGAGSAAFGVPYAPQPRSRELEPTDCIGATVLGGLLGLQEIEDLPERNRKARRHGQDMLAALADLQRALTQSDPSRALERLATLVQAQNLAADPLLATILAAISLRVRVELARRNAVS